MTLILCVVLVSAKNGTEEGEPNKTWLLAYTDHSLRARQTDNYAFAVSKPGRQAQPRDPAYIKCTRAARTPTATAPLVPCTHHRHPSCHGSLRASEGSESEAHPSKRAWEKARSGCAPSSSSHILVQGSDRIAAQPRTRGRAARWWAVTYSHGAKPPAR